MFRGADVCLNAPSLFLLLLAWTSTALANVLYDIPKNNPLNIDWDPAPSPEDGPPLSAGALRDKALLPAEIGGILGAYVFAVLIVGITLLLLGRKLRRASQRAAKALDIEMVDPKAIKNIDTAARSPGANPASPRNFSWPSPEKDTRNPYIFPSPSNGKSPTTPPGTDPYVDARVVEADQEMMQRDLEDLYAHVMEQEEAKRAGVVVKEMPPPAALQRAPAPVPGAAPQRQGSPSKKIEKTRPSNLTLDEPKPKTHSRTSSIISSLKSPKRKGIRGMKISSPIPTPVSGSFPGNASDEEPLTPRYYAPPPPPPIPTDQVPFTHTRNTSSGASPTRSIASQLSPRYDPRHRPTLSQTSVASSQKGDPISASSATSQTPLFSGPHAISPPPSKFASQNPYSQNQGPGSAQSSTRALPFRQFEPALTSPSFMSTSTKTTVLERTSPVGGHGPMTGGLRTPWSAGAVPYSPYQPFTPMMPITPRLVTKEERKAKKKLEARTPVLEMIKGEDELWDSAY
jgi:hypothetical protein